VTQRRVIDSEWVKFATLRSTWITLAAAVIGTIGVGAIACWAINSHWSHIQPDERLSFSPITQSLVGVNLAQLAVGVLGVLIITGEYATGMIRATFAAVPKRLPVLWAKLAVFTAATLVLMLISTFVSFFVGQTLLHSHSTTLGAPHALQSVVGAALYLTVVGVMATSFGFIVRNTAGGIASVVGLLFVLPGLVHVLPSSWQHNYVPYLPANAGGALFNVHPDPGTLAPWTGFAVMCAWAAALLILAAYLLKRRDA
jgi:ABC-type transport system involved in multi-copper enzyme maturation permease subunit